MIGYIYVMTNPSMKDGLVKIGISKDPEKRRRSLSNASVPTSYELISSLEVISMIDAERFVFSMLADKRESKEFFRCTTEEAIEACLLAQKEVSKIAVNENKREGISEQDVEKILSSWLMEDMTNPELIDL